MNPTRSAAKSQENSPSRGVLPRRGVTMVIVDVGELFQRLQRRPDIWLCTNDPDGLAATSAMYRSSFLP